jgi:hypothetical protein
MTGKSPVILQKDHSRLNVGLHQSTDALGAQNFAYLSTFNQHRNRLKIGAESPLGGLLGPRTVKTKCGCFTAVRAFRHGCISFQKQFYRTGQDSMEANHHTLNLLGDSLYDSRAIIP